MSGGSTGRAHSAGDQVDVQAYTMGCTQRTKPLYEVRGSMRTTYVHPLRKQKPFIMKTVISQTCPRKHISCRGLRELNMTTFRHAPGNPFLSIRHIVVHKVGRPGVG